MFEALAVTDGAVTYRRTVDTASEAWIKLQCAVSPDNVYTPTLAAIECGLKALGDTVGRVDHVAQVAGGMMTTSVLTVTRLG